MIDPKKNHDITRRRSWLSFTFNKGPHLCILVQINLEFWSGVHAAAVRLVFIMSEHGFILI